MGYGPCGLGLEKADTDWKDLHVAPPSPILVPKGNTARDFGNEDG